MIFIMDVIGAVWRNSYTANTCAGTYLEPADSTINYAIHSSKMVAAKCFSDFFLVPIFLLVNFVHEVKRD